MADVSPMDRRSDDPRFSLQDDARTQAAVLSILLAEHPERLTGAELAHELVDDPADPRQRDAVRRAVRDLTGVGLLCRRGIFVLPGRVALDHEWLGEVA